MIQTTILDMLCYQVRNYDDHFIYVVREGDLVFYVGLSLDPVNRMHEHVYGGRGDISRLGHFIRSQVKHADSWQVELLTLEECKPYVDQYGTSSEGEKYWNKAIPHDGFRDRYWLEQAMRAAEGALIQHYHPCLNVEGNPTPTALAKKYISAKNVHAGELSKLFHFK